jgi:hypothetical protein
MFLDPRHSRLKALKRALALALIVALTASCAEHATRPLRLGAADSGSKIEVQVGSTFDLDLGGRSPGPWTLAYPRPLLSLERGDRAKGRFHLLALHAGTAKLVAWPLGSCAAGMGHGLEIKCPLSSPMSELGDRPVRPFQVTVHISEK